MGGYCRKNSHRKTCRVARISYLAGEKVRSLGHDDESGERPAADARDGALWRGREPLEGIVLERFNPSFVTLRVTVGVDSASTRRPAIDPSLLPAVAVAVAVAAAVAGACSGCIWCVCICRDVCENAQTRIEVTEIGFKGLLP